MTRPRLLGIHLIEKEGVMAKPNYTKPTVQVDLEQRLDEGDVPHGVLIQGTDPKPSENGFVGVDPIYQNFADETHKPFRAEDGAEAVFEEVLYAEDADFDAGATPETVEDAEDDEDELEDEDTPSPTTPSTPSTPTLP